MAIVHPCYLQQVTACPKKLEETMKKMLFSKDKLRFCMFVHTDTDGDGKSHGKFGSEATQRSAFCFRDNEAM